MLQIVKAFNKNQENIANRKYIPQKSRKLSKSYGHSTKTQENAADRMDIQQKSRKCCKS